MSTTTTTTRYEYDQLGKVTEKATTVVTDHSPYNEIVVNVASNDPLTIAREVERALMSSRSVRGISINIR